MSLAQMFVDAYTNGHVDASGAREWDWSYVTGNLPKLILSVESLTFDFIFITQHYILYGDQTARDEAKSKGEGLLDGSVNGSGDSLEGSVNYLRL